MIGNFCFGLIYKSFCDLGRVFLDLFEVFRDGIWVVFGRGGEGVLLFGFFYGFFF